MKPVKIAPSILAADFGTLSEEMLAIERGGADLIHIDVMDGVFVPPISFGEIMVETAKKTCALFRETHLMITRPIEHVASFIAAGSDRLIIHQEAEPHLHRALGEIRAKGCQSGVALNPGTPIETLFDVLQLCDVILIMTVNPGWGGQAFIEHTLQKIELLRKHLDKEKLTADIEVDGGIDEATAKRVIAAGATVLVAGSSVFKKPDRAKAIAALRK